MAEDRFARTAGRMARLQDERAAALADRVRTFLAATGDEHALDVGCGAGALALALAPIVADVVGIDRVPELLALGRERAPANVAFVEGDAEALPFADESFDRVLSVFGVMFAPRQKVAAAELARVCRPGGSVVVANWTPGGFFGHVFASMAAHLPPAAGVDSPALWGDERHIRKLLGGQLLLAQELRHVDIRPPSRDAMAALFNHAFGPFVMARKALGDERFEAVLDDFRALIAQFDSGEDAEPLIRAEYLLTVAHRP
jgi:SAM-dependent methyltransferase